MEEIRSKGLHQAREVHRAYVLSSLDRGDRSRCGPAHDLGSKGWKCKEIDVNFNCHGLSLAAGEIWLDDEATKKILSKWCTKVDYESPKPGESLVKIFVDDRNGKLVHSQTLLSGNPNPDEKGGSVRYRDGGTWIQKPWERTAYYRCAF